MQGLRPEPNFPPAGISHHHAVSSKSDKQHYPCSFALIHFLPSILYPEALRAAHPSAFYADAEKKP